MLINRIPHTKWESDLFYHVNQLRIMDKGKYSYKSLQIKKEQYIIIAQVFPFNLIGADWGGTSSLMNYFTLFFFIKKK